MLARPLIAFVLATAALHAQTGRGGIVQGAGATAQRAGAGVQAPPPSDCAASGTVTNALTGEPIPRAMVTLGNAGSATDAQGKWSISNSTCGNFYPQATREGFISSNAPGGAAYSRANMIQLVSGTPVNDIRLSLLPGGAIAGSVRDSQGDPVESARIQLMTIRVQQGKRIVAIQGGTQVDSEGNFRIGSLTPGHYVVCAESSAITYPVGGGDAMVYRENCFPGPVSSALANSMQVEAGREVRTAFTLTATRGVSVRGTVSGVPAPAANTGPGRGNVANIQLLRAQNGVGGGRGGGVQRDGTFELRTVQPGSYILRATLPLAQSQGAQLAAQVSLEVGDSDIDNVVLAFEPPGSITGNIRYELSKTATSAAGNLNSGASNINGGAGQSALPPGNPVVNVNLLPAVQGSPFFGPIPQARWDDAHTSFEFAGVPSGQLRLNANVNGAGAYIKSATLRGQDVLNQGFNANGAVGPIEIVVSDDTGSVDITVNDANGQPVSSSILLLAANGQRRIVGGGDDGHASARNIPTGDYRAWAFDNVNAVPYAEEDWLAQNSSTAERFTVTSAGGSTVTLKKQIAPPE